MIDAEPLALLRCPRDGATLARADGGLACARGHAYPVRDGIPRFAEPRDDATTASFAVASRQGA